MGNAGIIGMGVPQEVVKFSGVTINIASGTLSTSISGQTVVIASGAISVSGQTVILASGVVQISGQAVTYGLTISTNNSTTTPLGSGATFSGLADNILNVGTIAVSVLVNTPSMNEAMQFAFSQDNVNWIYAETTTVSGVYGSGGDSRTILVTPKGPWFRLNYSNTSGLAQMSGAIQTVYYPQSLYPNSRPLYRAMRWNDTGVTTKSIIAANNFTAINNPSLTNEASNFANLMGTSGGSLFVTQATPTFVYFTVNAPSLSGGGDHFTSGETNEVFFQNLGLTPQGPVYIAPSPYSGVGILLQSGQTIGPISLNDTSIMAAFGTTSGTLVAAFGGGAM